MTKRRPPEAYLGGHSVVHANTSEKCLAEQAQAHKRSAFEAQAEFEREQEEERQRRLKTIEDANRQDRERLDAQRAMTRTRSRGNK